MNVTFATASAIRENCKTEYATNVGWRYASERKAATWYQKGILKYMVQEVNTTQLAAYEALSWSVYFYDLQTDTLSVR